MHRQRPGGHTRQCSQPVQRSISSVCIEFVLESVPSLLRANNLQKKHLLTHTWESFTDFLREIRCIVCDLGALIDAGAGLEVRKRETLVYRPYFIETLVQIAIDQEFPVR